MLLTKPNLHLEFLLILKKVFDTVDYKILLSKLTYFGIRTIAKFYFINLSQFVSINGFKSHHGPIAYSVPQGSFLGPLLFLIFYQQSQLCNIVLINFLSFR